MPLRQQLIRQRLHRLLSPYRPLSVSPSKLNTISTLRDTVGNLEAEFTKFQIVSSGDIQQLKDKIVQQDNLLKLQKKTIDEIVCDLSTQVKSTNDELRQQSLLLKKLQEDNHFLQKKNTKLEKEAISPKEQVINLQRKPSELPVPLSDKNTTKEEHEEELIVTLPLENRFSVLQEPGPQTKESSLSSLSVENKTFAASQYHLSGRLKAASQYHLSGRLKAASQYHLSGRLKAASQYHLSGRLNTCRISIGLEWKIP